MHEHVNRTNGDLVNFFHKYLKELDSLKDKKLIKTKIVARWKLPLENVVKINFDVAFDKSVFKSGLDVMAKNEMGKVIAFGAMIYERVGSAFAAEALACTERLDSEQIWVYQR